MWQRAQTLYLAISTILIATLFFSVKASAFDADGIATETVNYVSYIPYLILLIVITLLNLLALFSFKILVFQYRTAVLTTLITIAFQAWLVVDFVMCHNELVYRYTAVFPIVAVILDILAARGILSDQLMVESSASLRKSRRERRAKTSK